MDNSALYPIDLEPSARKASPSPSSLDTEETRTATHWVSVCDVLVTKLSAAYCCAISAADNSHLPCQHSLQWATHVDADAVSVWYVTEKKKSLGILRQKNRVYSFAAILGELFSHSYSSALHWPWTANCSNPLISRRVLFLVFLKTNIVLPTFFPWWTASCHLQHTFYFVNK
jgi:hypothetical protein